MMTAKREISLELPEALLDEAKALDLDLATIVETALRAEVKKERARIWREENAEALAAEAAWIETHGHVLADIMLPPFGDLWKK